MRLDDVDDHDIRRALTGDQQAFARLVGRYQTIAYRVAYLITRNAGDAEEATQEAFLRVYQHLRGFRLGTAFRPWLLQIVANSARTVARRARRHEAVPVAEALLSNVLTTETPATEDLVIQRDELRAVARLVADSPIADQQILVLRYFLDLSEAEIAASLGCRRGTVKSRLSRATQRLRQRMTAHAGAHQA